MWTTAEMQVQKMVLVSLIHSFRKHDLQEEENERVDNYLRMTIAS